LLVLTGTLAEVLALDVTEAEMKDDLGLKMRTRKLLAKSIKQMIDAAVKATVAVDPSDLKVLDGDKMAANAMKIEAHWRSYTLSAEPVSDASGLTV